MNIPAGATHRLKQGFKKLDQPEFLKWHEDTKANEWFKSAVSDDLNCWSYIPKCLVNIELYEPIVDVDSDSEDACFNAESANKIIINLS